MVPYNSHIALVPWFPNDSLNFKINELYGQHASRLRLSDSTAAGFLQISNFKFQAFDIQHLIFTLQCSLIDRICSLSGSIQPP